MIHLVKRKMSTSSSVRARVRVRARARVGYVGCPYVSAC